MSPKIRDIFSDGEGKGLIRVQYDEETGDLYINDKKMAYDVKLTCWQNFFAFGASTAVMIGCLIDVIKYFNS